MKTCPCCKKAKPLDQFGACLRNPDGKQVYCKPCRSQKDKDRRAAMTEAERQADARERAMRFTYGITVERYDAMLAGQGGVCAVCKQPCRSTNRGRPRRLAVDHDRRCCPGKKSCGQCVRGLLCLRCNTALGAIDAVGVEAFVEYLT